MDIGLRLQVSGVRLDNKSQTIEINKNKIIKGVNHNKFL